MKLNRTILIFSLMGVLMLEQVVHCQKDLLNFLVEQNEAAKEKIKTAQSRVEWTMDFEAKEGLRHDEGFGEVKMKEAWRLSTQECNASIPATAWKQKQTQSMVINDKYLAYWPTIGNAYIYQDDHQSLNELSDDSKLRRNIHTTPDIYSFSFAFGGERNATFKEMMKLHPDKIKWTAEETKQPNGDMVYLIKRYSPFMNDPAKPDAVWTVDPQKGFMVTQALFYSKAGNVWVTRKTEPKEIGSGIWVPASYQEHRYGKPTDLQARGEPTLSTIVQLEDITINHEISDDYFVIESILPEEHRESTTLFRKGLDGNTKAYVYWNGGYILREDWHNLDHTVAKTLEDLHENPPVAEKEGTVRESQSQLMKKDQATSEETQTELTPSEETHIPLGARDDDRRLVYVLFGLAVVVLVVFISKFGKQILERNRK
jgi:hypothetical protein